ncbi:MAG: hypothetical protein ACE5E5_03445 [Phycisphaerae bacterium]
MKTRLAIILFLSGGIMSPPAPCAATQAPDAGDADHPADPLASKEEMIRERFKRFEDRVFRLQEQLSETEPENARRLARVLERAGELGLSDRLERITKMLEQPAERFDAVDEQMNWLEDAQRVLGILLERDSDNDERKDKIERLQSYKERLEKLLSKQQELEAQSAQATLQKRLSQQLDQAINRIDGLLQDQAALEQEDPSGADAAAEQEKLAEDTADLAEDLGRLAQPASEESTASEAMEAARKSVGQAAGKTKQAESHMAQASGEMKRGKPSASSSQAQAKKALREALKRLQEAKEALKQEAKSSEMAGKQDELAEKAESLADEIQKQEGDSSSPGGTAEGGEGQSGQSPPPGTQGLEKAKQHMNDAGKQLEDDKPAEANTDQQEAIEELQQAREELEDALEQLRKEEKAETLRDLELRFREMLSKQRVLNAGTDTLAAMKVETFERAEQLQLADLAAKQRALAQDAATCLLILDEDGTTIVFPRILEQVGQDMTSVAKRLGRANVGSLTRQIEQEIVTTLEQLLEAVEEMQQENEQAQSRPKPPNASDDDDQLLPESAELRLLRSSQLRVNERTDAIEEARLASGESQDSIVRECKTTAKRQRDLMEVATQIRERKNKP